MIKKYLIGLVISLIFPICASATDFGVNYKSLISTSTDITYWNTIGLNGNNFPIRVEIYAATTTNSSTYLIPSFVLSKQFKTAGFYTICGVTAQVLTSTNWQEQHDATMWWVNYVKENDSCDQFDIGNEYESRRGSDMSTTTLIGNLKNLAADIKAIWPTSTISYAVCNGCAAGGLVDWNATSSLGDIDRLGVNIYGEVTGNQVIWNTKQAELEKSLAKYGSKIYISEFNVDSNNSDWANNPVALNTTFFRSQMDYFRRLGISQALIYEWRGWHNVNNDFAMQNTDGTRNLQWTNNFEAPITVVHNFGI